MSGITTSASTLNSNVYTTSRCDKKDTKLSTSTPLKFSGPFSGVKNTPTQQSSNPSTSSSSLQSNSKEKTKKYSSLNEAMRKDKGVKTERKGHITTTTIPGGFAIAHSKNSKSSVLFSKEKSIPSQYLSSKLTVKSTTEPYTVSFSGPSGSKEKARGYTSLKEAAKKEEGVKIEKKGGKTKVTISGASGFHLGTTTTHKFTPNEKTR
ncbi:hypothetical protein Sant_P0225 (plasmid) [Sodalis praecaptivus]|uniref:Uncharacterized protein n=2 Tax=Sodalis praecaptivus TaxID=1239307 RepID=W0HZS8_9GAMM|nr:hypothetical protein Sant_P0225 [Sodalis praecaptivus]